jgi:hypothetical protein
MVSRASEDPRQGDRLVRRTMTPEEFEYALEARVAEAEAATLVGISRQVLHRRALFTRSPFTPWSAPSPISRST